MTVDQRSVLVKFEKYGVSDLGKARSRSSVGATAGVACGGGSMLWPKNTILSTGVTMHHGTILFAFV